MTINITGTITSPISGEVQSNAVIRFIAATGSTTILPYATSEVTTDGSGNYDIELEYGHYTIWVKLTDTFEYMGYCIVNESSPTPMTLQELLEYTQPIPIDQVTYLDDKWQLELNAAKAAFDTDISQVTDQVVDGDASVVEQMTTYTNDRLGTEVAELVEQITAGNAQVLNQATAYSDTQGNQYAQDITALQTQNTQIEATMVSNETANGTAHSQIQDQITQGDASVTQAAELYTDTITGELESSILDVLQAGDDSISTELNLTKDRVGNIEANWEVKATIGELTSSMGMVNDGNSSEVYAVADKFSFTSVAGINPITPFTIVEDKVLATKLVLGTGSSLPYDQLTGTKPPTDATYGATQAQIDAITGAQSSADAADSRITAEVAAIDTSLAANALEIANLDLAISDEENARITAILAEQSARAADIAIRVSAEATLDGKITTEEAARISAVNALDTAQKEYVRVVTLAMADGVLTPEEQALISAAQTEVDLAKARFTSLETDVSTLNTAVNGINTTLTQNALDLANIDSKIDTEEQARITAVTDEQTARIADIAARVAEEAALDGKITVEEQARIDAVIAVEAAYKEYSRIVTLAIADGTLTQEEQDLIAAAQVEVNAAKARFVSIESDLGSLNSAVSSINTTLSSNAIELSNLDGRIDSEETARIAAILNEQNARAIDIAARITAEANLDGKITAEEASRIQLGTDLTTAYQAYTDTVKQALIDGEITDAEAAAIAEAQVRVNTAKAALQLDIDAVATDATQALADAAGAQSTADGKIETFFTTTEPVTGAEGDIWIRQTDKVIHIYQTGVWTEAQDSNIATAIANASTAQSTADGKVTTFYQASAPTPEGTGDLWVDTDALNELKRWNGSQWISMKDGGIDNALAQANQALSDAANAQGSADTAQSTADGKITTFYQTSAPTLGMSIGDLWFDTDNGNVQYRYSGSEWITADDTRIGSAINAAQTAQTTADGKAETFYQATAPTTASEGDLWVNTANNNRINRYSLGEWESLVEIDTIMTKHAAIENLAQAIKAQAVADGKIETYFQDEAPIGLEGDIWFDTNDGNKQYVYQTDAWVVAQDTQIGQAIADAAGAQATADGRVTTFYENSAPTANASGDLWVDTDDDNRLHRWDGAAWVDIHDAKIDLAQATADTAQAAADTVAANLASAVTDLNADIADLQTQVDGSITTWFDDYVPTLTNEPTLSWTTDTIKDAHISDLFYDNNTGYAYRFQKNSGVYSWQQLPDTDVALALANAATAQDTADGKRRVFVATPTAPYDIGDLWAQGGSGELMKCKAVQPVGGAYNVNDWEAATSFATDISTINSTTAQHAIDIANLDGDISAEEAARISAITTEQNARATDIAARIAAEATLDGKITDEEAARIQLGTDLTTAYQNYADTVKQALIDGEITDAEANAIATAQAAVDAAEAALNISIDAVAADVATLDTTTTQQALDIATVDGKVGSEEAARISAITAEQSARASDIATRVAAEATLDGKITTEEAARIQAVNDLDGAYKEYLRVVTLAISDGTLTPEEQTLISAAQIEVDAAKARFSSLETTAAQLQTDVSALDTTSTQYALDIAAVDGKVDTEEAARISAITTEQTTRASAIADRISAEALLDGKITAEENARIQLGTDLTTAYQNYANTVKQALIDGEISDAEAAAIATAQTALDTAKAALQADIDATDSTLTNFVDVVYAADLTNTQNQLDDKIETWVQLSTAADPKDSWLTSEVRQNHNGDVLFFTDTKKLYWYDATLHDWNVMEDQKAIDALANAASAQSTADGKITSFYTATTPTPEGTGDLWIDTDNDNELKRWNGTQWVSMKDSGIDTALANANSALANAATAQTTANTANTAAGTAQSTADTANSAAGAAQSTADTALSNAAAAQGTADSAAQAAFDAQSTADGKINSFYQNTEPTSGMDIGDIWIDKANGNTQYRYSGSAWEAVQDSAIVSAITAASDAQTTADTKVQTYFQTQAPAGGNLGDLWIDTDNQNELKRWNGSAWVSVKDAGIAQALTDAATAITDASTAQTTANTAVTNASTAQTAAETAQSAAEAADSKADTAQATADGKIATFYQTTAPTSGMSVGDLWFDQNNQNQQYRYNGSDWVLAVDTRIGQAVTAASNAQSTADGKVTTFYAASAPTAEGVGDLWIDTSNDNQLMRWTGSAWDTIRDSGIGTALQDAADAQQAADNAQATADGKINVLYSNTAPTEGMDLGDLWIDSDDGNKQYRWNGSIWIEVQDTAIGDAIDAAQTAQTTADGKATTYYSDTAPTEKSEGDLWVNIANNNRIYRWSGDAWDGLQDVDLMVSKTATIDALATTIKAQATADGKIVTFFEDDEPTTADEGDIWFDTNEGNKQHVYQSGSWVEAQDTAIGDAITAAAGAQATADGKVQVFYEAVAPITTEEITVDLGDLWVDTANGNILKRWDGDSWESVADAAIQEAKDLAATKNITTSGTLEPEEPTVGDLWHNTGSGIMARWDGTNWVTVGDITDYADTRISNNQLTKAQVINSGIYPNQSETVILSDNYSVGVAGWAIDQAGIAEFNAVTVRGNIYASTLIFASPEAIPEEIKNDNAIAAAAGQQNLIPDAGFVNPANDGGRLLAFPNLFGDPELTSSLTAQSKTSDDAWGLNYGGYTGELFQEGSLGNAALRRYFSCDYIPVEEGTTVCFSVYTGAHRCKVTTHIQFYDKDKVWISEDGEDVNDEEATGGTELSGYKRLTSIAVVPANARYVRCKLAKHDTKSGEVNSHLFYVKPQFSVVPADTTIAPDWVSGDTGSGSLFNKLKATRVGTSAHVQISSDNFVSGSTGWGIDSNGDSEFNNVTVRGHVEATSGSFSGLLDAATLQAGKIELGSSLIQPGYENNLLRSLAIGKKANGSKTIASSTDPYYSNSTNLYGLTHSSSTLRNRVRADGVDIKISASCIVDHYASLYYKIGSGSWVRITGTTTQTSGDDTVFMMGVLTDVTIPTDSYIKFGVSATDANGDFFNSGKAYVNEVHIIAEGINW